jgi:hypothetical protein
MAPAKKRSTGIFIELIELWTAVLAIAASFVAVCWPVWCLTAAPLTWALVIEWLLFALLLCAFGVLHWLLLDRVTERRRWACLASAFLGVIYLFPPTAWSSLGPWRAVGAVMLAALMACVIAAWDELTDGW